MINEKRRDLPTLKYISRIRFQDTFWVNLKALSLHPGRPAGLQRIVNLSRKNERCVLSPILEKDNTSFFTKKFTSANGVFKIQENVN